MPARQYSGVVWLSVNKHNWGSFLDLPQTLKVPHIMGNRQLFALTYYEVNVDCMMQSPPAFRSVTYKLWFHYVCHWPAGVGERKKEHLAANVVNSHSPFDPVCLMPERWRHTFEQELALCSGTYRKSVCSDRKINTFPLPGRQNCKVCLKGTTGTTTLCSQHFLQN